MLNKSNEKTVGINYVHFIYSNADLSVSNSIRKYLRLFKEFARVNTLIEAIDSDWIYSKAIASSATKFVICLLNLI